MEWKDTTTYSRGDQERKPTTWTLYGKLGKRITITNGHINYKGEWIMHCEAVGIKTQQIWVDGDDLEEAKAVALLRVAEKVNELSKEWDLPEVSEL